VKGQDSAWIAFAVEISEYLHMSSKHLSRHGLNFIHQLLSVLKQILGVLLTSV
jgi:hypothetical protein